MEFNPLVAFPASDNNNTSSDPPEEENECRVCRGEEEPDRKLFCPCKCSGSIKWAHADCLKQWLAVSGKKTCELCKHEFVFSPLYAEGTPERLPWSELGWTFSRMLFSKYCPFVVRFLFAMMTWLVFVPWTTTLLYRFWLQRTAVLSADFTTRFVYEDVLADVKAGVILVAFIVFSFLALMSFADFLRFQVDEEGDEEDFVEEEFDAVDEAIDGINEQINMLEQDALQAEMDALGQMDEHEEHHDEGEEAEIDEALDLMFDRNERENDFDHIGDDENNENQELPPDVGIANLEQDIIPPPILRRRVPHANAVPADNIPALDAPVGNVNVDDNVPADAARRRRRRRARNRNNRDDDMDGVEFHLALDELFGLTGDISILFRNVGWFIGFNGAYMGLFIFAPFTIGFYSTSFLLHSMNSYAPDTPAPLLAWITNNTYTEQYQAITLQYVEKGHALQVYDAVMISFGYFLLFCGLFMLQATLYGLQRITNDLAELNQLVDFVKFPFNCLKSILKVSCLLSLKMIGIPIFLGMIMDYITMDFMFSASFEDRFLFTVHNMVGSLAIHWVFGITFMLIVTISVLQLREVVHPDLLAQLIRPQEAHLDLLKTLLEEPLVVHSRRMVLSILIYCVLLVLFIAAPIQIVRMLCSECSLETLLGFQFEFSYILSLFQVPIELIGFHLIALSILEKHKNNIGHLQFVYFKSVCTFLGLERYLLPIWNASIVPDHPAVILRPPPLLLHPATRQEQRQQRRDARIQHGLIRKRASLIRSAELRIETLKRTDQPIPAALQNQAALNFDGFQFRFRPWPETPEEKPEHSVYARTTPSYCWLRLGAFSLITWTALVIILIGLFYFPLKVGNFVYGSVNFCLQILFNKTIPLHCPFSIGIGIGVLSGLLNGIHQICVVLNILFEAHWKAKREEPVTTAPALSSQVALRTHERVLFAKKIQTIVMVFLSCLFVGSSLRIPAQLLRFPLASTVSMWSMLYQLCEVTTFLAGVLVLVLSCYALCYREINDTFSILIQPAYHQPHIPAPADREQDEGENLAVLDKFILSIRKGVSASMRELVVLQQWNRMPEAPLRHDIITEEVLDEISSDFAVPLLQFSAAVVILNVWLSLSVSQLFGSIDSQAFYHMLLMAGIVICIAMKFHLDKMTAAFHHLHDTIRDNRYLIGQQLHNHERNDT